MASGGERRPKRDARGETPDEVLSDRLPTASLDAEAQATPSGRWELYRLLSDPVRLRMLSLAAAEELAVGELSEVLGEGQPKISRHAAQLRDAGLLLARKQGTWTWLRLSAAALKDPVVADALQCGNILCQSDGMFEKMDAVIRGRDSEARAFFALRGKPPKAGPPSEFAAYLCALSPLIPFRHLAVDAGTGDGALLELLAPIFEHVIALDRSEAQLELAAERGRRRAFSNIEFVCGEMSGPEIQKTLRAKGFEGADAVFAVRMLHHAAAPAKAVQSLSALLRSPSKSNPIGGYLCILDYEAHGDQALREKQADLWLGFEPADLRRYAENAGLLDIRIQALPPAWRGDGPDRHLPWQLFTARRGASSVHANPVNASTDKTKHVKKKETQS